MPLEEEIEAMRKRFSQLRREPIGFLREVLEAERGVAILNELLRQDGFISLFRIMLGFENAANVLMEAKDLYPVAAMLIDAGLLPLSDQQRRAYEHPVVGPRLLAKGILSLADVDVPGNVAIFDDQYLCIPFRKHLMTYAQAINLTPQQIKALKVMGIIRLLEKNKITLDMLKKAGNVRTIHNKRIETLVEDGIITYKQAIHLSEGQIHYLYDDFIYAMAARGQFDVEELPDHGMENFENPVFREYVDLTGYSLREALNIPQATIARLEGDGLFEFVASYRRAKGSRVVQRLKQWITDIRKEDLLDPEKIADQDEIAQIIVEYIGRAVVETVEDISAIYDAIGIGFGDKQGLDEELSVLRYRNLNMFSFHKNMGYRETNDSEKIARACIEKMKDILIDKNFRVSDSQDELYRHLLAQKISRSGHGQGLLQWYDEQVREKGRILVP